LGARFGVYFGIGEEVRDYRTALRHDREKMLRFIASSISEGVYFHDYGGVACHHGFCRATEIADVDEALERLDRAIGKM
jgi:glutamate-1-semialdehyde aminotransferase